jgi:phosphocarrier protein HPr
MSKVNEVTEGLIQVGGRWGLNGHGSARVAVVAARFDSDIVCIANGCSVNGKDVMSVLSLRAKAGTRIRILATGPDEAEALEALAAVLIAPEST